MITLEEAIKMAKEERPGIDMVVEFENGYVFSGACGEGYIGGLNHSPVVILKETGEIVSMITFVNEGTGTEIARKPV